MHRRCQGWRAGAGHAPYKSVPARPVAQRSHCQPTHTRRGGGGWDGGHSEGERGGGAREDGPDVSVPRVRGGGRPGRDCRQRGLEGASQRRAGADRARDAAIPSAAQVRSATVGAWPRAIRRVAARCPQAPAADRVLAVVCAARHSKPTQTEPIPKQVVDIHLTGTTWGLLLRLCMPFLSASAACEAGVLTRCCPVVQCPQMSVRRVI